MSDFEAMLQQMDDTRTKVEDFQTITNFNIKKTIARELTKSSKKIIAQKCLMSYPGYFRQRLTNPGTSMMRFLHSNISLRQANALLHHYTRIDYIQLLCRKK